MPRPGQKQGQGYSLSQGFGSVLPPIPLSALRSPYAGPKQASRAGGTKAGSAANGATEGWHGGLQQVPIELVEAQEPEEYRELPQLQTPRLLAARAQEVVKVSPPLWGALHESLSKCTLQSGQSSSKLSSIRPKLAMQGLPAARHESQDAYNSVDWAVASELELRLQRLALEHEGVNAWEASGVYAILERCHSCSHHSLSTRHDELEYASRAKGTLATVLRRRGVSEECACPATVSIMAYCYSVALPGVPKDLQVTFGDFRVVTAVLETTGGCFYQGRLLEAQDGRMFLTNDYDEEMQVPLADVVNCQLNAMEEVDPWSASYTSEVPLSWVNRLVSVKLAHGEVYGLLSDASLDGGDQFHLQALPGSPAIPPLPTSTVKAVALVPRALHVSWQTSSDEQWRIHRYHLQVSESVAVRELHTHTDWSPESSKLVLDDCDSDIIPLLPGHFQMKYTCIAEPTSYKGRFYRCPAPALEEGKTAAQSDAYRMSWVPAGLHFLREGESEGESKEDRSWKSWTTRFGWTTLFAKAEGSSDLDK
ncbi:unnamed protein product [Polarella glacialis]|uniref:Uncharacterized protein n=1 Tax=Polarella glacialis TaxID=89957 RepID=A0A813GGW3_POLGL|nr:unnamed protein product [Polarella glacialis]